MSGTHGLLVAGIDSSTQSCTVEIRRADDGALLGSGGAPHPVTHPPVSEQDPARWWSALTAALAAACADAGIDAGDIDAVSVGAQCHGMVVLDADDTVVRPAKLWNDTTSGPQAARLVAEYGAANWVAAIGLTPSAALTVTKLAWLAEHEPANLARLRTVLLPHDYLTFRLTGEKVTDRSEASGTGYYAAAQGRWLTEILERFVSADLNWAAALPRVLGPDETAGTVQASAAAELGLRTDVMVGAGGGDQHLGALGLGLRPGDVAYSFGTSGVVLTTTPDSVHDTSGWVDGVADAAGGYLPLVCTLNCTKVTDTFARVLGVTPPELGDLALAADPSRRRPVLVAYLDGERSPARPAAEGLLAGLTTDLTREDFALAVVEGVISGIVRGHQALTGAGIATGGEIVAAGGGARSTAYRQVLADQLGRPVHTRDAPEATARGACVQAAAVLTGRPVTRVRDAWCPPTTSTIEPRVERAVGLDPRYTPLADWRGADRPS
ncbi:xylulokinase [Nakamurella flavida]|uniref:Xylulose kinase n=1 Tax=Nakamurella flavida TaxID=363630 RepID=A0A938YSA6_9ACTN|nr:xylulokinase [Nakamurella flavida]MBM9477955.1 xylulokinase [Nakamurella flavida]MDP9778329.1 xylulokinase [Nakamurella flavida]